MKYGLQINFDNTTIWQGYFTGVKLHFTDGKLCFADGNHTLWIETILYI